MLSKLCILASALQVVFASTTLIERTTNIETPLAQWIGDDLDVRSTNQNLENDIQTRQAYGNAIVSNRCNYDVWIWSVDQNFSSEAILLPARTKHIEPFRSPCDGCGVSFKVSKSNQIIPGQHTQFEYSIAGGIVYYDISYVDCAKGQSAADCPGHERGHAIDSPEMACGRPNCASGTYCPTQSYYVDYPLPKLGLKDPVFGCGSSGVGMNIYFKMCSDDPPLKRSIAGRAAVDDFA